ncbi:keratin-associated protein 9-1 [Amia ocellicauda]|uniref:keratin-associated protein 9-1 n=1 Tax=Amia ocellicauda TaxID=2972642 RepID=UPI0034643C93
MRLNVGLLTLSSVLLNIASEMVYYRSSSFSILTACLFGVVVSQTTLGPSVTNTTGSENSTVTTGLPLSTVTPGCFSLNTSTCAACAPGTYYDNGTLACSCCPEHGLCVAQTDCQPCARGHYQPLAAQELCLPCSQGFYTNSTGSPVCQPCPAGTFSNSTGSEVCQGCSLGYYTSKQNATSCEPCPQGTFCNSSSCAQCPRCPGGFESLQPAAKQCTPCRPGMHKVPSEVMCRICNIGFYQIRWGQESCDICPKDHYCPSPDVNPILCPGDAFCPAGSTAPGYCMETFLRKAGNSCELAPVTIVLLVLAGGMALLFIILLVLRRRRETDQELAVSRAPLLRKERPPGRVYGVAWDAEPVYAVHLEESASR